MSSEGTRPGIPAPLVMPADEFAALKAVAAALAPVPLTLRDVLRGHYLAEVICDHEGGQDNPVCACSLVFLGWHGSVGLAVEAWVEHVMAEAARMTAAAPGTEAPASVPASAPAAATEPAEGIRERLEAALDESTGRCPRCKVCDTQIGAAMTVLGPLLERAERAEAKLAEIAKLNGHSGWLTPAEVQRRIWAITGDGQERSDEEAGHG